MKKKYIFEKISLSILITALLLIGFILTKTIQSVWLAGFSSFFLIGLSLWLLYSFTKTKNQPPKIPVTAMGEAHVSVTNTSSDIKEEMIEKLMDLYQKEDVFKVVAKLVSDYLNSKIFKIILCNQDQMFLFNPETSTKTPINLGMALFTPKVQTSYEIKKELKEALSELELSHDYIIFPFFSLKNLEGVIIVETPSKDISLYPNLHFVCNQVRIILDRCLPYEQIKKELETTLLTVEKIKQQAAFATLSRGIAHEIKNPLGQLKLWAGLVFERPDDQERIKAFAKTMVLVMTRLKDLVESMLKYKDADSGKKEFFDLNEVIKDVLSLSEPTCNLGDYLIKVHKEFNTIPQVYGDRLFTYFAIMNLMVNAMEHTPKNGEIKITTSSGTYLAPDGKTRDGVVFKIEDNGKGIAKENLEKIFDPFFTTGTSDSPNVGLGLSLVFRVVTSNNGKIEVDSEENKGSTFTIYFPIEEIKQS